MKSVAGYKAVKLVVLSLLATGLSAALANAQEFRGTFTLSVETRWGAATLPAGEYSLILDHHNLDGKVLVSGKKLNAIVLPRIIENRKFPEDSALFAVRSGGKLRVRSLYIKPLGLFLEYPVPERERQIVAQAPQLFQRLPIVATGR
jgi:hypothetical protein